MLSLSRARCSQAMAMVAATVLAGMFLLGDFRGPSSCRAQTNPYQPAVDKDPKKEETKPLLVLGDLRLKHSRTVHSVAFSPNGKRLASGCSDTLIRIWDVSAGK